VKNTLIYVALTTIVAALLATTIDFERFERRQPGEGRRESRTRYSKVGNAGDESAEAKIRDEQFAEARTAPGIVLPGAYSAAFASLSGLPVAGGSWNEVTNRPYNADDHAIVTRSPVIPAPATASPQVASSASRSVPATSMSAGRMAASSAPPMMARPGRR